MPTAEDILAAGQKNTAAEADESVKAGKATVIKKPYQGLKPVQTTKTGKTVAIKDSAYNTAQQSMETARKSGSGFKATLAEIYKKIFERADGIPVTGMEFNGIPYNVQVSNSVLKKVISDPNISAEKLAVLEDLPEIITNAEYVGSGEYNKTEERGNSGKIRYDYFETDAIISGKPYVVSFDVEVLKDVNNYRTHKITEIELTPKSANRAAPAAAVSDSESVPTVNLPQQTETVNQNLSTNAAVDKNGNDLTTREGAAAAMAQRKQAEAEKRNNADGRRK